MRICSLWRKFVEILDLQKTTSAAEAPASDHGLYGTNGRAKNEPQIRPNSAFHLGFRWDYGHSMLIRGSISQLKSAIPTWRCEVPGSYTKDYRQAVEVFQAGFV